LLTWTSSPTPRSDLFLFLDRDGVINLDRDDYIKTLEDCEFYPDALEALAWLNARDIEVILISNQSGLNRGIVAWDDFWAIHEWMIRGVREAGGDMLAAFYCPHHPDEGCSCRKPSPGMILAACGYYPIPLEKTHMIGDRKSDVLAAENAGCRGVLLNRPGDGKEPAALRIGSGRSIGQFSNLLEAVRAIFPGRRA
jgi:D-glycero-D-manno-heptose 1,7-bisphosphate phosphatase